MAYHRRGETGKTDGRVSAPLFIRDVTIDWDAVPRDAYVRDIAALTSFDTLRLTHNVTLFAGENGTGKSTLLEAMAVAYGYNAEGGSMNFRFTTYDDVSPLHEAVHLTRGYRVRNSGYFFRAESFFNVASIIQLRYNDDGRMPDYHAMSHGESFLDYLGHDAREGVYLMDEPEAALSPTRQLALIAHVVSMAQSGSQFVIATHSPLLLGIPGAGILEFSDEGICPVAYEETESYQIYRLFLDDRASLLHKLLDPEEP